MKDYEECCDFFMLGKNDDMRQKSDKFFKFFTDFFNDVNKSMPKVETKKKKNPRAGGMAVDMMAELKKK